MKDIDWAECPECTRTVALVGGVLGGHIKPKEQRRWPKLAEECPRGGTAIEPVALLGDI